MPHIRPFLRPDRDQLLALANSHIAAVLPGGSVPASALLSQMERDPSEYVLDPWVLERVTIVGVADDRIVAAAHLKRYRAGADMGADYRDAASVDWMICWPDHLATGRLLLNGALEQFRHWGVRVWYADGSLPCLGVYGIPDAWPHLRALLKEFGFDDRHGQAEIIFAGHLAEVAPPGPPPVAGVAMRRVLGSLGTNFEAVAGDKVVGVFEVVGDYTRGGSVMSLDGWADVANHWVEADHRGHGIGTWLFRHGCTWLKLGGTWRLLSYALDNDELPRVEHYYARHGLCRIGRTRRGWSRTPDS